MPVAPSYITYRPMTKAEMEAHDFCRVQQPGQSALDGHGHPRLQRTQEDGTMSAIHRPETKCIMSPERHRPT
mgnify:CR=1 FL=1